MAARSFQKIAVGVALVVGVLVLGRPHEVKAATPRRIQVTAKRFAYEPAEITLKKGEPVVIALHSEDVAHGVKFAELNVQTDVAKGATGEIAFTPQQTGDFVGHCSHFCGSGHGTMTLTLHITE